MTDISSRVAELERRVAAVERAVFGDDPQREAELRREDDRQPDIRLIKEAAATARHDREGPELPDHAQQVSECVTAPSHDQRLVADLGDAVGLVADPAGGFVREVVSRVMPDTPAGRLVADVAGGVVLAAEHLHPASLALRGAAEAWQLQDDIWHGSMKSDRRAHAQHEQPQLEAGA